MKLNILFLLDLIGFGLCRPDPITIAPLLIKQEMTWPMAQNYCRENHIDLFTITNATDQEKLTEELEMKNEIDPVWTGLYIDLENWYWSYNHLPLENISLRSWKAGYPNNAYGENVCVFIDRDHKWTPVPCYYTASYMCYDANNSPENRIVGYGDPRLNWRDARAHCREHHTDLATTTNEADMIMIKNILISINWIDGWIGLTRDTWKWSDGAMPSYLPWLSGQPDNQNTWENCAATQSGQLVDEKCTDQHYFVCSDYLFRKQTVRLYVKSNESVHNPALQSSILELINQKLQELGMVNITVKWRVWHDGNIFYKKPKDKEMLEAEQNCHIGGLINITHV